MVLSERFLKRANTALRATSVEMVDDRPADVQTSRHPAFPAQSPVSRHPAAAVQKPAAADGFFPSPDDDQIRGFFPTHSTPIQPKQGLPIIIIVRCMSLQVLVF